MRAASDTASFTFMSFPLRDAADSRGVELGGGFGLETLGDELVEGSTDEAAIELEEADEVVAGDGGVAGDELGDFGHSGLLCHWLYY